MVDTYYGPTQFPTVALSDYEALEDRIAALEKERDKETARADLGKEMWEELNEKDTLLTEEDDDGVPMREALEKWWDKHEHLFRVPPDPEDERDGPWYPHHIVELGKLIHGEQQREAREDVDG